MLNDGALARLKRDEICIVVLPDGSQREATWSPHNRRFFFTSAPAGSVSLDEIEEWWPARPTL